MQSVSCLIRRIPRVSTNSSFLSSASSSFRNPSIASFSARGRHQSGGRTQSASNTSGSVRGSEHSTSAGKPKSWLGALLGGAAAAAIGLATALAEPEGIRDLSPATEEQHVNFKLGGKVAFVTGGGSGIGHHVALVLAKSGCDVAVLDINAKLAEETAALIRAQTGRRAIAFHVDVRNYQSLELAAAETVKQLGRLDFCVANAGIVRGGSVVNMPENELADIIDVNIKGVFNTVKAASREMIKLNQGGRVIAISSANAEIAGSGASAYCGTKAAVKMMVRCWAQDLIPFGITVNCIGPGATDTALMIAQVDNAEARQGLLSAIPMGRMAHPAEVGWLCAFYCSQEAAYLTGTFMLQDGGLRDHTSAATPEILEIQKQRNSLSGDALLAAVTSQQQDQTKAMQDQRKKFGLQ